MITFALAQSDHIKRLLLYYYFNANFYKYFDDKRTPTKLKQKWITFLFYKMWHFKFMFLVNWQRKRENKVYTHTHTHTLHTLPQTHTLTRTWTYTFEHTHTLFHRFLPNVFSLKIVLLKNMKNRFPAVLQQQHGIVNVSSLLFFTKCAKMKKITSEIQWLS